MLTETFMLLYSPLSSLAVAAATCAASPAGLGLIAIIMGMCGKYSGVESTMLREITGTDYGTITQKQKKAYRPYANLRPVVDESEYQDVSDPKSNSAVYLKKSMNLPDRNLINHIGKPFVSAMETDNTTELSKVLEEEGYPFTVRHINSADLSAWATENKELSESGRRNYLGGSQPTPGMKNTKRKRRSPEVQFSTRKERREWARRRSEESRHVICHREPDFVDTEPYSQINPYFFPFKKIDIGKTVGYCSPGQKTLQVFFHENAGGETACVFDPRGLKAIKVFYIDMNPNGSIRAIRLDYLEGLSGGNVTCAAVPSKNPVIKHRIPRDTNTSERKRRTKRRNTENIKKT